MHKTTIKLILLFTYCLQVYAKQITLMNDQVSFTIATDSLAIKAVHQGKELIVSSGAFATKKSVLRKHVPELAIWDLPELKLTIVAKLVKDDLKLQISSDRSQKLLLLNNKDLHSTEAIILPLFGGVYIPTSHNIWKEFLTKIYPEFNTNTDINLPLISFKQQDKLISIIFMNRFNNFVSIIEQQTKDYQLQVTHDFNNLDPYIPLDIIINVTEFNMLSGAKKYRQVLREKNKLPSLLKKNNNIYRLLGAMHLFLWGHTPLTPSDINDWSLLRENLQLDTIIPTRLKQHFTKGIINLISNDKQYTAQEQSVLINALNHASHKIANNYQDQLFILSSVLKNAAADSDTWGGGLSHNMLNQLDKANIKKLWLGFSITSFPHQNYNSIAKAIDHDWLVSPIYTAGQLTLNDNPEIYHKCRIKQNDSHANPILNPRCHASYAREFIDKLQKKLWANSLMINHDVFGRVISDNREQHALSERDFTIAVNSKLKWAKRELKGPIATISSNDALVEDATLIYGITNQFIWHKTGNILADSSEYFLGKHQPSYEPESIFQNKPLHPLLADTVFNYYYRIPLFQAVFNESVITSNHPFIDAFKFKELVAKQLLMSLLHNHPPSINLSLSQLDIRLPTIKKVSGFFAKSHPLLVRKTMETFNHISSDGSVQEIQYSDGIACVANFANTEYDHNNYTLPALSITLFTKGKKTWQLDLEEIS